MLDDDIASHYGLGLEALAEPDSAYDVVLLLGPRHHLVERADRVPALEEAWRVLRPGGTMVCAVISRSASLLSGVMGVAGEPSRR